MTQEPPPSQYHPPSTYPEYRQEDFTRTPYSSQGSFNESPRRQPLVTYAVLGITILVFLLQLAGKTLTGVDLVAGIGLKVNELILQGQYWRLLTPVFLHGSLIHLGFNMYALFIFGPGLERYYGHLRFALLYFLAGFAGNVMSFMFSAAPSLGSSTAIFGLLGAEAVFLYRNQSLFGGVARRALYNLVMIALVNLLIGLSPGIDNWGHIGGLVGGTLFAWVGGPLLRVDGNYPLVSVVDERQTRDAVVAALVDGAIFGFLAVATIFIRST